MVDRLCGPVHRGYGATFRPGGAQRDARFGRDVPHSAVGCNDVWTSLRRNDAGLCYARLREKEEE